MWLIFLYSPSFLHSSSSSSTLYIAAAFTNKIWTTLSNLYIYIYNINLNPRSNSNMKMHLLFLISLILCVVFVASLPTQAGRASFCCNEYSTLYFALTMFLTALFLLTRCGSETKCQTWSTADACERSGNCWSPRKRGLRRFRSSEEAIEKYWSPGFTCTHSWWHHFLGFNASQLLLPRTYLSFLLLFLFLVEVLHLQAVVYSKI